MEMTNTTSRANNWLYIATALYFVMNGAQLWETAIMVPAWTAGPPASLFFFKTAYGLDFKFFWIIVHSIHEIFLLLALLFNWRFKQRRNAMLFLLLIHIGLRVWTLQYFVPTLMSFMAMKVRPVVEPGLLKEAIAWKNLNYVRVGLYILVNIGYVYISKLKTDDGSKKNVS
ncbi:transposase [Chryseobacterium sp. Y16C]|uniref:transposase n=1 Tax=Chryseobacterium sp. Y16C TaxID=2920939 RepID=UPI001F0AEDCC|nr:transposase [Chryseobacterium sp. Y16C]UMQ42327.1 transposase [Chryseobacterium sp. Y16C]